MIPAFVAPMSIIFDLLLGSDPPASITALFFLKLLQHITQEQQTTIWSVFLCAFKSFQSLFTALRNSEGS